MKSRLILSTGIVLLFCQFLMAQNTIDSTGTEKKQKIKTGWTFGAVPAITYSTDLGFQYGAVVNFFYFGDGKTYPAYLHNIYLEWSRYTKGSGINQIRYDSEHLIPGVRVSGELSYLTEQALDFYGFNGYQATFNSDYSNDKSSDYISRMFYRMDRKMFKLRAEFLGNITNKKFRWLAGFEFSNIKLATVDIAKLNKGKKPADMLPDTSLLYDKYVQWGLIPQNQKDGGNNMLLKLGLVYDTRDNEPNPMKGIWTEFQLLLAPSLLGNDFAYSKLVLTHRQYFTLVPNWLSFVYRVSYQGKLTGTIPYYMLPFEYNTAPDYTRDGFGGSKTMRGVLRNRVVGDGVAFGNLELRWKFLQTVLWNQNIYLALSSFIDGGMVTNKYKLPDLSAVPAGERATFFPGTKEGLHIGYGGGLHIALNENFVVAIDAALAAKKDDGNIGFYIGLDWLF